MNLGRIVICAPLIYLLLLPASLKSQLPGMKVYTQLDGYPGIVGYHINQDAKGFIWVGTDNGVACFDGKKFKVIDDKDGLTDKEILLPLPYKGQCVLLLPLLNNIAYWKDGKVFTQNNDKRLGAIKNKTFNSAKLDIVTQKAWVSDNRTGNTIYCFSADTISAVKIKTASTFQMLSVINNKVYMRNIVDTIETFGRYDLINHTYTSFQLVCQSDSLLYKNIFTNLDLSPDGKYLLSNDTGRQLKVFTINGNKLSCQNSITLNSRVRFTHIDRYNHLWIALENSGIEYWGNLAEISGETQPLYFLDGIIINHMLVDRSNNLWFTAQQKGLFFISRKHWENAKLTLKLKLPALPPRCIIGDSQNIYIGHSDKSCATIINNGKSKTVYFSDGSAIGARSIIKKSGIIYLAGNRLQTFTPSGKKITFSNIWAQGAIKDVAIYKNDYLLLAQHRCAALIKFKQINNIYTEQEYVKIFTGRTSSLAVLPDSSILIGTPNGLYHKASLMATPYKINNAVLVTAHITDIEPALGANTLIATNGQGLYNYNYITGIVQPVLLPQKNPGLIRHIFKQNDTIYWISSDKGAYEINITYNTKKIEVKAAINYTFFDGLPSNNITSIYVQKDTAYIATSDGLGILPLKTKLSLSEIPELWITRATLEDTLFNFPGPEIHLKYWQNNIQLALSAICYESMGNIKYLYRLRGLSDRWVETENPEINFSGLPPGNYFLDVYATNFKGVKSNKPLLLSIIVHPAFWQTLLFKWLIGIVAATLLFLIAYRIILRVKNRQYRQMQQKRRLAELELEAIKAQINPHFVYNCLNSIQYLNYKNDYEPVKKYFSLFARLIRQTMQYSKESFITLEDEVNYLENYLKLEKIRFKEQFSYHIYVSENLPGNSLIPSMLVQPYVENALKHGIAKLHENGEIWITFKPVKNNKLQVLIEDNGPGFKPVVTDIEPHFGNWITGSRAAAYKQLFGLDIQLEIRPRISAEGIENGTTVELLIPPVSNEIVQV